MYDPNTLLQKPQKHSFSVLMFAVQAVKERVNVWVLLAKIHLHNSKLCVIRVFNPIQTVPSFSQSRDCYCASLTHARAVNRQKTARDLL